MEAQNKWELLSRYLAGECTEEERVKVETWAKSSREAKEEFKQYNAIWEATSKAKVATPEPDSDRMWNNILYSIEAKDTKAAQDAGAVHSYSKEPVMNKKSVPLYQRYAKIAAAFIVTLLVAILAYLTVKNNNQPASELSSRTTGAGEKAEFLLSDGTHIWLNENSALRYPASFNNGTRKVYLEGEAFFEVAHDEQQPFTIHAGEVITKVVGTSFNVQAINKEEVAVTVVSGKVVLFEADDVDNKVLLEKGDRGVFHQQKKLMAKDQNKDLNFLAWQTGILTFRNTDMNTLINSLEAYYDVNIKLADEAISKCQVTATFDNQPLEEVLEVLKLTLDINYLVKGNKIVLKGEGCS